MFQNEFSSASEIQDACKTEIVFIEEIKHNDIYPGCKEIKLVLEKNGERQELSFFNNGIMMHGMEG